ncbi:MAG: methyl-accepting chemotaxis protein [Eubacteriales bacterium]|nr:methyl-accepting chemotaxis protein [Eubacteriales bacterium]
MEQKGRLSLIKKVTIIVFILLVVSFVAMNVITIEYFKMRMLSLQGVDTSDVSAIVSNSVVILTGMAVGVSILLMLVLAVVLYRMIVQPVKLLGKNIKRMSEFDLTEDASGAIEKYSKRSDEIGMVSVGYETMRQNIVSLLAEINGVSHSLTEQAMTLSQASGDVSNTAGQLSITVGEIANGATAQADEITEGDRQIIALSDLIQVVQDNMEIMDRATKEVAELRESGLQALNIVVEDSKVNNDNSHKVHEVILETSAQTKNIQSASAQIREIAGETNMLALNASIEAARAGEAGKGFAVVATEIGNLASATNELTATIESIIQDLVTKMDMTVSMMENMGNSMEEESKSMEQTEEQFNRIANHLQKMGEICADLEHSTNQMEASRSSIVSMIENLSAISQENAASMEEAAAAVDEQTHSIENMSASSQQVAEYADHLTSQIEKFKV